MEMALLKTSILLASALTTSIATRSPLGLASSARSYSRSSSGSSYGKKCSKLMKKDMRVSNRHIIGAKQKPISGKMHTVTSPFHYH